MQANGHRCLIMRSFYEFHRKKTKPVRTEARNKYDSETERTKNPKMFKRSCQDIQMFFFPKWSQGVSMPTEFQ
jgi:hypothetical protein